MKKNALLITASILLTISAAGWIQDQDGKLLPSEAQKQISVEVNSYFEHLGGERPPLEEYNAKWTEITLEHLPTVKTTELSSNEQLIYSQLLSDAGRYKEARAVLGKLIGGTSLIARKAQKQLIQIAIDDDAVSPTQARGMLADYRSKFAPSMEDRIGLFSPVRSLARQFDERGDKADALAVIREEIAYLFNDPEPNSAWMVIYDLDKYMTKDEAIAALEDIKKKFEAQLANLKDPSEVPETQRKEYEKETRGWKSLVHMATAERNMVMVMNAPAPDFTFTHFFNTEPIEFSKLRGKVVVLDFWANWCAPCIASFPQMRKMYADYKGKGVQIISITGFQGSMVNHGKGLKRITNISEEKELKLTKQFIEYHNVTWPIAFSTRGCFDIEYGIQGIPMVVIIDKKGNVRMFSHPSRHDDIIAMIEKLRAE